jgi:MFS family permease
MGRNDGPDSRRGAWLALTAALLGWMFDGLEMGLFPLVANPALRDLLGTNDKSLVDQWFAIITAGFLIGAATGGVLFGWLGDRIGRVRAMMLSVLTYAIFSGAGGLATEAWQVAAMRFVAALGMGGEWALGVALVMEVWPNRSRALLAGIIGAAANFGYLIIGAVGLGLTVIIADLRELLTSVGMSDGSVAWLTANDGWRVLMLFGAVPAVLTLFIQMFVPESHKWVEERKRGATAHWEARDLFGVLGGALAGIGLIALWVPKVELPYAVRVVGSLAAFALLTLGYLYPTIGYLRRSAGADGDSHERSATIRRMLLAAVLSGVALLATWGCAQWAPVWADQLTDGHHPRVKTYVQMATAFGAVVGCVLAALMGDWFGRRRTYAVLCLASLASVWGFYNQTDGYGPAYLVTAFLMGGITASFYGWLPLYLPELFRTKVRATGQGFGFNFGRVLAAVGVLQLPVVKKAFDIDLPTACSVLSLVYVIGFFVIWLAPETKGKPLPE